jgi:hypothetical protein
MGWQRFSFAEMRANASVSPPGRERGGLSRFLFPATIFGVAFCIGLLYQAMRPIMRLGGMVASGGPYAIEHPAPPWVWVMPLAILAGMACFFINLFTSPVDGVNLMPLAWPGLFLSLGWNFLEFAFAPPAGKVAWGWLVCGVTFVLMGGIPLLLAFAGMRQKVKAQLRGETGMKPYIMQWLLVVAGIVAAIYFFRSIAGIDA